SDLLEYMKVHHMTRERRTFEVYAREINEPLTLAMFLKAHMRIPEQAAHDSGMMPPTHSEIIPPTVPR
ncbi:MAG: hypothetical protein WBZ51_38325, partial [Xanthobacteraceae bacterium]